MPGTKDAAYWAARRAQEKQSLAESGRRKRPGGRMADVLLRACDGTTCGAGSRRTTMDEALQPVHVSTSAPAAAAAAVTPAVAPARCTD